MTVYGTPAEESVSGKIMMLKNGCTFEELDVALMMHGAVQPGGCEEPGPFQVQDCLPRRKRHAAVKPEKGRSCPGRTDYGLSGSGIFTREHVADE